MRILMLGNSLTTAHGLPDQLAELLDAEVVVHARGGARLAEQLNPKTRLGARTQEALASEHWDIVTLQEMSNAPCVTRERFVASASKLCEQVRSSDAVPLLYATWPYAKGSPRLEKVGLTFDEMRHELHAAYHEVAAATGAFVADVGEAFCEANNPERLWSRDGVHPTAEGAQLAAQVIAETIKMSQLP